jgi:hypothetical protein
MSELIVVGITGKARAGKDSVSNALATFRGCKRVALADGVRAAFNDLSGVTGEYFKTLTPEFNYRKALQTLGTEARWLTKSVRVWTEVAMTKIAYAHACHPKNDHLFVIPDVRYMLEVAHLMAVTHRLGGKFALMKVIRPNQPDIAECLHSSETEMEKIKPFCVITNSAGLPELCESACTWFDEIEATARPTIATIMREDLLPKVPDEEWQF